MRTPRSPFAASLFGPTMVIGAVTGPEALHAADGWVVSGQADQPLSHGEPAIAVLQPGAVSVHRHPPSGSPRNTVAGVVTGLEPVGHLIRVRVGDLKADITPAAVADLALAIGQPIHLAVKAAEVTLYPAPPR